MTRANEGDTGERCTACSELTAVGTPLFSGRRVISAVDGTRSYLCPICDERARSSRSGKRLTDQELKRLVENGSLAGMVWSGDAGMGGPGLGG